MINYLISGVIKMSTERDSVRLIESKKENFFVELVFILHKTPC